MYTEIEERARRRERERERGGGGDTPAYSLASLTIKSISHMSLHMYLKL
jgi:hypothetical protein